MRDRLNDDVIDDIRDDTDENDDYRMTRVLRVLRMLGRKSEGEKATSVIYPGQRLA